MKYIFNQKRNPEKGARISPFPNIFQGVILLNKSSTRAWLEIILLANTKQLFPLFHTLFLFQFRKPFGAKNLYGRVKRRWISIFETMGIHLRLARPIEDPSKEKNAHNSFLQKIMRSHNGLDSCPSERATKPKSANFEKKKTEFPSPGYGARRDTCLTR